MAELGVALDYGAKQLSQKDLSSWLPDQTDNYIRCCWRRAHSESGVPVIANPHPQSKLLKITQSSCSWCDMCLDFLPALALCSNSAQNLSLATPLWLWERYKCSLAESGYARLNTNTTAVNWSYWVQTQRRCVDYLWNWYLLQCCGRSGDVLRVPLPPSHRLPSMPAKDRKPHSIAPWLMHLHFSGELIILYFQRVRTDY